MEGSFLIL
jgi:NADH-quinone oxidoreductase subunit H